MMDQTRVGRVARSHFSNELCVQLVVKFFCSCVELYYELIKR